MSQKRFYRVLLVDQNPRKFDSMRRFFERARIELDFATNCENGLKKLSEKSYDLIALDSTSISGGGEPLDRLVEEIERLDPKVPMVILGFDGDVSAESFGLKGAKLVTQGQDQLADIFAAEIREHALRRWDRSIKNLKNKIESGGLDFSKRSQESVSLPPAGSELTTLASRTPRKTPVEEGSTRVAASEVTALLEEMGEIAAEMHEQNQGLMSAIQRKDSSVERQTATSEVGLKGDLDICERMYESFVENFKGIAFRIVIGPPRVSAFVHGAVEEITGYTKEEYLNGDDLSWLVHPDDLPGLCDQIAESRSIPNYSAEREYRIIRKDGEIRWVHEIVQNICDESGKPFEVEGTIYDVTDRKMAEEALKESEEKLDLAIEGANLGIWNWDMTTDEVIHNARYSDMVGLPPELLKSDMSDWKRPIHPDDLVQIERGLDAILKGKVTRFEMDYRLRWGDSWRWIHDKGEVVSWDEAGNPIKMAGIMQDVTDKKNAEEELRRTYCQMMKIIDLLPDATFVIDKDRKVIAWNREIEKMTGVSKEEIVGGGKYSYAVPAYGLERPSVVDFVFSRDEDIEQYYDYVERKGDTIFAEVFVPSLCGGKGAYIWIKASSILDEDGNIAGAIQSIRDITDRKMAEEELRQAHRQLQDIIDFLPDATFVIDKDRTVIAWNKAIERMTGISEEEVLGKSDYSYSAAVYGFKRPILADLVFSDDKATRSYYDYVERKGDTVFAEVFVPSLCGGKGAYIWIKASPLFGKDGKVVGVIESLRDITNRKRAEEELRQAHHQLQDIVDRLPDATFVVDRDRKVIAWNRAIERMTGITKESIIGKNDRTYAESIYGITRPIITDFVFTDGKSKDDVTSYYDYVNKVGDTVFAEVFVSSLYGGKGAYIWIKASPLFDDDGNIVGAIQSTRDITEKKRIEDALRESEERYRVLVELSPEAIGIHSEGKFVYMNSVGVKLHGAESFDELDGRPLMDFIHPDYQEIVKSRVQRCYEEKKSAQFVEEKIVRLDGTVVDIEVASVPITYQGKAASLFVIRDITERKRIENHLKQLADISGKLIEISNPMLCVIDQNKRILIWNRAAEEVTGYTVEDATAGTEFWDRLLPDSQTRRETLALFEFVERGGPVLNQKIRIKVKSGEDKMIAWNGLKLEDSTGKSAGVVVTGQDVTEHIKMEEEIRSERELSRSIIQGTDLFIASLDKEGVIHLFNKGAENMTGYSGADVLGKNFLDLLIPTAARDDFQREIESVVKEGSSEQMEGPLLNCFGEEIALQWSWSAARDSSGAVERVIATGQDMSYNRWLEEQMLLFMDAVESSNDGIAIFDRNGHLLFANPALLDMFGFRLDEVRGKPYSDFIQEREEIDKREINGRGWRGRMTCIRKDKTTFPASVSFAPVSGRDGSFTSIVAIVRDISQSIDYERKLESLNRELESFAYTISHDLRAPLRGIQGFTTFLMDDCADQLDETGRSYLERIVRSSANMDRLILDLLDYSRVGRIKGLPEQLKMDDLVQEAYEEVRFLIKDRDVRFCLEGEFPTIVGEKSRIKQIFANLLSNSLKYTGEKPEILVGCVDRGDRYEFWVQDNGKGFDMTYHDRIFEPFYRLDRSSEGTGIGLATVKKIVETYGGTIWADSVPGEGSTFRFYLSKRAFKLTDNN